MLKIIIFCLIIIFCSGFSGYMLGQLTVEPQYIGAGEIKYATECLITARDAHQYFVDNPEKIWWTEDKGQELEWVDRYNKIIAILDKVGNNE